eukprot:Nitzschia sp. Nitz4//scaffold28_size193895//183269//184461//NITZ4_001692-RA/size193895-augustus-gene-0.317-mRNA-1//-1//CDS//3329546063//5762//frame0
MTGSSGIPEPNLPQNPLLAERRKIPVPKQPPEVGSIIIRCIMFKVVLVSLALVVSSFSSLVLASDTHENCRFWAESGECDKNPDYMWQQCAVSCERVQQQQLADAKELQGITSFFDLGANDIHGSYVDFAQFKGEVTILVNVASYCGYTDPHYKQLVQLWKGVQQQTQKIHILAFPCNQFGAQEPESNQDIWRFATHTYGVDFQMMEKIDVNGPYASPVYKYLKKVAGPSHIGWNFATYYVVAPDGTITSHSGVEPLELHDMAIGLLGDEL